MRTALLLGLPDTIEAFRDQVLWSDCLSAYGFRRANPEGQRREIDEQWNSNYWKTVGTAVSELAKEAGAQRGVTVYPRATLENLVDSTQGEKNDVVIVFAHWKGPDVKGEDLSCRLTLDELLRIVSAYQTSLAQWIANRIDRTKRMYAPPADGMPETAHRILNRALDADFVDEELEREYGFVDVVLENEGIRRGKRRAVLDTMLGDYIAPGNRLELSDGLHDVNAVVGAVSKTFTRILDLTNCQSTYLADRIRRERPARTVSFPHVQNPVWACDCLRILIPALGRGMPYSSAREYANRRLAAMVGAERERS